MTEEIQPEVTTVTDDLDAFAQEFFGKTPVAAPVAEETPSSEADEPTEQVEEVQEEHVEEPEEVKETPEEPKEAPKKSRFQERIDELTARNREAAQQQQLLQQKLAEAIAKLESQAETKQPPLRSATDPNEGPAADTLNEKGEPKYPLGEFDPQYIRDRTQFEIDRRWAEITRQQEEKEHATRLAEQQNAAQREWNAKLEAAAESTYPDILDQTPNLEPVLAGLDPKYGEYLAQTVMGMDKGPDVLYYLATHTDEARRIASLGAIKATIALGRIEQQFVEKEEASKKQIKVSKAPAPAPQAKGSAASIPIADDTDDLDAFAAKFLGNKRRK